MKKYYLKTIKWAVILTRSDYFKDRWMLSVDVLRDDLVDLSRAEEERIGYLKNHKTVNPQNVHVIQYDQVD